MGGLLEPCHQETKSSLQLLSAGAETSLWDLPRGGLTAISLPV